MNLKKQQPKLTVIFIVLLVLINFPILSLTQSDVSVASIPLKVLYVFAVWFLAILFTCVMINK